MSKNEEQLYRKCVLKEAVESRPTQIVKVYHYYSRQRKKQHQHKLVLYSILILSVLITILSIL